MDPIQFCEDGEGASHSQSRIVGGRAAIFPMSTAMTQTRLGSSLPERIGNTPLIRLEQPVRELEGITLLAKAEWANPGGSVKDRAAASIVRDAIARRLL